MELHCVVFAPNNLQLSNVTCSHSRPLLAVAKQNPWLFLLICLAYFPSLLRSGFWVDTLTATAP
ncbi:unnamed protein product [Chondrus crispus]|uniref:Uncharacterized protein n=1 Tax=Chondrus crispus TaxID=2769 RepID=R7QSS2_CHOCR|nr:unnamed protein product [Chondrus crispus]CDF41189.1 unnamed protein product [Chondrus crispus]|eukprot:XP_005711483.1 unnamed protein product [Chondrus crispus]